MTAALILPISGPYTATWNALPMGIMSDDGYELSCTFHGQEINATDVFAKSMIEGIYQGQSWRCRIRGLEFTKTGLLNAGIFSQFGATNPGVSLAPELLGIGDRLSKSCQAMILTAILSNPPSVPQTLTALLAGIAPNSQSSFSMTSKMRELPIEIVFLPYATTISSVTYYVPFTTT